MRLYLALSILILTSGCLSNQSPIGPIESPDRFQILQLGSFRRDAYMIDKKTGQLWQRTCFVGGKTDSDCEYSVWLKTDVEDVNKSRSQMIDEAIAMEDSKKKTARK